LEDLRRKSSLSLRRRKNHNLYFDYADPCQRLFNAIEMTYYIRLHRHSLGPKYECLVAVSGLFCLYIFDDTGKIIRVTKFGSDLYRTTEKNCGVDFPKSETRYK
jgi:cupin fold WbuC family metalloprotein